MGKNISKRLSNKFNQKSLEHAKQSATEALKTFFEKTFKKQ